MDGMRNSPPRQPNDEPQPQTPLQPQPPLSSQPPAPITPQQDTSTLPPIGQTPEVQGRSDSSFMLNSSPKKKKKWLPLAIIGGVLALLLLAAGAAYALYQKPENVLRQALFNAATATTLSAKGTMAVESADGNTDIRYDLASNGADARFNATMIFPVDGSEPGEIDGAVTYLQNGEFYVKADKLEELIEQNSDVYTGYEEQLGMDAVSIIRKIDNKWIRISQQDLKDMGMDTAGYDKSVKCYGALQSDFKERTNQEAVANLYRQNEFLLISQNLKDETVNGRDSFGYKVTADPDKTYNFAKGVSELGPFKEYAACTGEKAEPVERSDFDDLNKDTTYEVWVDKWNHQFSRIRVSGGSDGDRGVLVFDPIFNQPVDISAPTQDVVTLKQLSEDPELQQFFALLAFFGVLDGASGTSGVEGEPGSELELQNEAGRPSLNEL